LNFLSLTFGYRIERERHYNINICSSYLVASEDSRMVAHYMEQS